MGWSVFMRRVGSNSTMAIFWIGVINIMSCRCISILSHLFFIIINPSKCMFYCYYKGYHDENDLFLSKITYFIHGYSQHLCCKMQMSRVELDARETGITASPHIPASKPMSYDILLIRYIPGSICDEVGQMRKKT